MSQNITPVLVRDERLCPTDNINFAVCKSGSSITHQTFRATSQTPSSHVYNIFCPSVNTIISSELLWESTVTYTITGTVTTALDTLVKYGLTDAFAAFPLHSSVNSMQCQINNASVSCNFQDVLPIILRALPKEDLLHYASVTPTYLDNCATYDAVYPPMPAVPVVADLIAALNAGRNNNPLSGFQYADENHVPRGTFAIQSISGNTAGIGAKTVVIVVKIQEPILLSPFTTLTNKRGFYGITNIAFTMQMDALCSRAYRKVASTAAGLGNYTGLSVSASYEKSQIIVEFLTAPADAVLPQVNVSPYYDVPRYLSTQVGEIVATVAPVSGGTFAPVLTQLTSNNIQLNQIPDRIFIAVKKQTSTLSYTDPDCFLPIFNVSINWNNNSGLLSTCDQPTLYNMSREAGYNDSWSQWSGVAMANPTKLYTGTTLGDTQNFVPNFITSGSVLTLEMGRHIPLSEIYYASGSIGQFNLQFNVTVANYNSANMALPEIILMVQNSGIIVNNNGNTALFTGVLSKADVMAASLQTPVVSGDLRRMVGRGFWDSLKSGMSRALPYLKKGMELGAPLLREHLEGKEGAKSQMAAQGLKALGYGMSGGGESGGKLHGRYR